MKRAKVFQAEVNGTSTQVKAYKKSNAIARFQQLDPSVKSSSVYTLKVNNSHQTPVEDIYPEICK